VEDNLLARARELLEAGVQFIVLLALGDEDAPRGLHWIAQQCMAHRRGRAARTQCD